jgi:hypothetical protein
MQKAKPILEKKIFWDVDFAKIDYDKYPAWVIERVFERGDVDDIRQVRSYYGDEKVIASLTKAKWLRYDIFVFCKNLFNLKANDFRCYILKQSKEIPWLYC